VKLLPGEAPSTEARSTASVEAYREFLLGRQFVVQGTREGHRRAVAAFERAVEADPSYGAAWAGLATARFWYAVTLTDLSETEAISRRAMEDAERAIAVRPRLADGYAVRGLLRRFRVPPDWEGAEADLRRALELNPRDPVTLGYYGSSLLAERGRLEEGIAALRRGTEIEPLSAEAWFQLGRTYTATDLPRARAALERALEIAPDSYLANAQLNEVLALEGKGAEARAAAERVGDDTFRLVAIALAEHVLGRPAESERALAEVKRRAASVAAYQIAQVYAFRGERERALEWLERAWDQRDPGLAGILLEPMFQSLRGEPRFTTLLRKLRLPTG
jgi:serine/threonine-protein kinase